MLLDPDQDLLLRKADICLDPNVGNQSALDLGIDGLHIDLQERVQFFYGEHLRHIPANASQAEV